MKFIEDFFEKIDLEIISDRDYFDRLFSTPQKAEILIVSEDLYDLSLQKHNIGNVFLMTEQYEEEQTADLNLTRIFKYTSIKEIFNEIQGKSASTLNVESNTKQEPQIIVVTSAAGGVGKKTVAMGISACLAKQYKKVLYINASRLQNFQYLLDNNTTISSPDVYSKLISSSATVYNDIKHVIRKEMFNYLPAFKTSLMSVGIDYSVYEKIALAAKRSGDFDFIIIDAESTFDEYKTKLIDIADKVIIVTNQTFNSVQATNCLITNINGINAEKYIFICNSFNKESYNALIMPELKLKFSVNEYIENYNYYEQMKIKDFVKQQSIQRVSFLII